ncbi:hypothetical protein SAZ_12520 [Streptomyces noursei ZPM]|nr:hypothetical protein SAZ_12520 [Streptomyces noursei ZPM]
MSCGRASHREMASRAAGVRAWSSHCGEGPAESWAISRWRLSPSCRTVPRVTRRPLTRAPMQPCPASPCRAYAASTQLAPAGSPIVPPGSSAAAPVQKTVISPSWARSSRSEVQKVSGSGVVRCHVSSRSSQPGRVGSARSPSGASAPSVGTCGSPRAITPASATRCIRWVRIRVSATSPVSPLMAVCSDW